MRPVTPGRLAAIAEFAGCNCPASQPNMEKAREYLGQLVAFTAQLLEEDVRHLRLLEFQKGKQGDFDAWETAQNTIRHREEALAALAGGRDR